MFLDRFHVLPLIGTFRRYVFLPENPGSRRRSRLEDLAQRRLGVLRGHLDHGFHVAIAHAAPFFDQLVVFGDDSDGSVDLGGLAFDGQVAVILQMRGDAQRGFQQFDVFV